MLASDNLDKKIPSDAKLVISKADRSDVYTINKKVQDSCYDLPVNKQLQSDVNNQVIIHTKEDLTSLYPDCFTRLGKFQDEAYHIEVDPTVLPKRLPADLYLSISK